MAEKIKTLSELVRKLERADKELTRNIEAALGRCTLKVQATAMLKFGKYQPQVGAFPAWKTLSESYKAKKLKYGGEDPLIGHYGDGEKNSVYPTPLRNSILVRVSGLFGYVGTNDPLGKIHEFGAPKRRIPPRPFLRPALLEERKYIRTQMKTAITRTLKKM